MKTTKISKLSMNCNSLNTYLMDESLLLYSKNTQSDLDEAVATVNSLTNYDNLDQ